MNDGRGAVRNITLINERPDYSGLAFGKSLPMDIDGYHDIRARCAIFYEIKHCGAELSDGARLGLEHIVDMYGDAGLVLVLQKERAKCNGPSVFDAATLPVIEYRHGGRWKMASGKTPAHKWATRFRNLHLNRPVNLETERIYRHLCSIVWAREE